jgi:hypothetical protein
MACGTACEIKKYELRSTAYTKFNVTDKSIELGALAEKDALDFTSYPVLIGNFIKKFLKKRDNDDKFDDTVKGDGCGQGCTCVEIEPSQTTTTKWKSYPIQNPVKLLVMVVYWNSNNKADTYKIEISGEFEARAVTYKGECMPSAPGENVPQLEFPETVFNGQDTWVVVSLG